MANRFNSDNGRNTMGNTPAPKDKAGVSPVKSLNMKSANWPGIPPGRTNPIGNKGLGRKVKEHTQSVGL